MASMNSGRFYFGAFGGEDFDAERTRAPEKQMKDKVSVLRKLVQ